VVRYLDLGHKRDSGVVSELGFEVIE